ncbi:MAG: glycosyltransferase family 39 protein [Acidimicrobiales bacterium]
MPPPTATDAPATDEPDTAEGSLEARPDPAAAAFRSLVPMLALLGLVIRVTYAVVWRFDKGLKYDGPIYRSRAMMLNIGRGVIDPDWWNFHNTAAQGAIHPPGNMLLLAAGQKLGLGTDHKWQLMGCVLGTITIVLVAYAGRAIAGPRVGLIAAAIATVHPGFWSFDPTVMAETPGQLFTALTLLLAYRFWDRPTPARAGWMAGAAALAALTRSELLVMVPLLVLPLCLASRGTPRQVMARLGAATLWAVAVLGPWVGWNMVRFEHPVTMATGLDISLAYAQCDDTWYGPHTGYWNVFCGADVPDRPKNTFADESELGLQYRAIAGSYISAHRTRWPLVVGARVGRTLSLYRPVQQIHLESAREGREAPVLWGGLLFTFTTVVLAAVAFARPPTSRRRLLPLLVPLLAGTAGAAITFGTTRYRSAGEVGLTLLAAVGIDALLRLRSQRRLAATTTLSPTPSQ